MPVKKQPSNQNFTPNAFFTPAFQTPVSGAGRFTGPSKKGEEIGKPKPRTPGPQGTPLAAMQRENEGRKAFTRRIQEGGGGEAFAEAPQLTADQVRETQSQREEAIESLGDQVAPTIQPFDESVNPVGNIFEAITGATTAGTASAVAGKAAAGAGLGTGAAGLAIGAAAAVSLGGFIYLNIKSNQKQITTDAYEGFTNSRSGVVATDNQILNAAEQGADPALIAQRYNENLANALEIERVLTSLVNDQIIGLDYRKATDELRDVRAYLAVESMRRQEVINAINNPTGKITAPPIVEPQIEEGGFFG